MLHCTLSKTHVTILFFKSPLMMLEIYCRGSIFLCSLTKNWTFLLHFPGKFWFLKESQVILHCLIEALRQTFSLQGPSILARTRNSSLWMLILEGLVPFFFIGIFSNSKIVLESLKQLSVAKAGATNCTFCKRSCCTTVRGVYTWAPYSQPAAFADWGVQFYVASWK